MVRFRIIPRSARFPDSGRDVAFLRVDHWNDFSFVTMFDVTIFDQSGEKIEIGAVKIGFIGQTEQVSTYSTLETEFDSLPDGYFSLGQDVTYYQMLTDSISEESREEFLANLKDIVSDQAHYEAASGQRVLTVSLLRSISMASINNQFKRVLNGGAPLSDFKFRFHCPSSEKIAGVDIDFAVIAGSTPSTNIHAIIGRNGAGKTALLNKMIMTVTNKEDSGSVFMDISRRQGQVIDKDYFTALISVSFSAFDPFIPPEDQADPERGAVYYYVGLKDIRSGSGRLKSNDVLQKECVSSIRECLSDRGKRARWKSAISILESDENFAQMELLNLLNLKNFEISSYAAHLVGKMSTGHAVVLLTISSLVAKVQEKTLILLDEPESHLHPPLLSAFTRALSELLHDRNGVAIVATHSPVVLQEIPRSCARIITRSRLSMNVDPPRIETFGENVGVLTREVFKLEVSKSGFHSLLDAAVRLGKSYDEILADYDDQLGQEGRGILRAMIIERDFEGHAE